MTTIDVQETATMTIDIKTTLRMGLHDRTDHVRENLEKALERKNHEDIAYWRLCLEELAQANAWLDRWI